MRDAIEYRQGAWPQVRQAPHQGQTTPQRAQLRRIPLGQFAFSPRVSLVHSSDVPESPFASHLTETKSAGWREPHE